MYKISMMFRFLSDVDKEEAYEQWGGPHADLVGKIPGLLHYSQSRPVEALPVGEGTATDTYDGYVSHWYEDRASLERAMVSPEWAATGDDAVSFIDGNSGLGAAVEERVLKDGERGPFKVVWYVRFKEGQPRAQSGDYWTNEHGPLTLRVRGFTRYAQNHSFESLDGGEETPFDGYSEHWFPDRSAWEAALASPEWEPLTQDGSNFVSRAWMAGAIVEERFKVGGF